MHPNDFVRHLLEVFDEAWRVLKDDGVFFTSSSFAGRVADETRYASFAVLLGVRAEDARLVVSRWPRAIPQYSVSLPAVRQKAREAWSAAPGRVLFGNYTGQVSLRGMIEIAAAQK